MKITKSQLKQIIKEEIEAVLEQELPKKKQAIIDYNEGHEDGFEGRERKKRASKEYNDGYDDGKDTDKEYKKKVRSKE